MLEVYVLSEGLIENPANTFGSSELMVNDKLA